MLETIFDLILGWSIICLLIDGFTGWSGKGQYKKVVMASFVSVPIIGIVYILVKFIVLLAK